MRSLLLTGLLTCALAASGYAQENRHRAAIGLEQDVLPWILRGHFLSGWIGTNYSRTRVSFAQAETPAFMRTEDVVRDRVKAFGISIEYFLNRKSPVRNGGTFAGLWLGPGLGIWDNEITWKNGDQRTITSFVFSLGGGYNVFFTRWLYASPWLALHTRLLKPGSFPGSTYQLPQYTPELSLKLGIVLFPQDIRLRKSIPHPF